MFSGGYSGVFSEIFGGQRVIRGTLGGTPRGFLGKRLPCDRKGIRTLLWKGPLLGPPGTSSGPTGNLDRVTDQTTLDQYWIGALSRLERVDRSTDISCNLK